MPSPFQFERDFAIVMTATIVPNVTGVASVDPKERLNEYASAVRFYLEHAPVIFLENSGYDLAAHPEFQATARLRIRQFPRSKHPERGKGFQEFEMLDAWLASEPDLPTHWFKVTGRYQLRNIDVMLAECRSESRASLVMDQSVRTKATRTYAFWVATAFYRRWLAGVYCKCDDREGAWIERVLYRELKSAPKTEVRSFATQPRLAAISGASGLAFPSGRGQWMSKQLLRTMNRWVDKTYLWYSK